MKDDVRRSTADMYKIYEQPCRREACAYKVTLALVKSSKSGVLRIWYGQGLPVWEQQEPDSCWHPYDRQKRNVGVGWQLWVWQRVMTLADLDAFVTNLRSGRLVTDSRCFLLRLLERPIALVPAGQTNVPLHEESAWLQEFWDARRNLLTLHDDAWVKRVNEAVEQCLGVNLDAWRDRIGNVALFAPTGIKTQWNYDAVSGSAVIKTNLKAAELDGYEVELEAFDGEEISYRQRIRLQKPSAIFRELHFFQRVRISVWRKGQLLHQARELPILSTIVVSPRMVIGQHGGTQYTYSEGPVVVGASDESEWLRRQRNRRVELHKKTLAENLNFKFYEPRRDDNGNGRKEAVDNLRAILNRAEQSVQIWDPYFGSDAGKLALEEPLQDLTLLEGITSLQVGVQILTSADDWTEEDGSLTLTQLGKRLQRLRQDFAIHFKRIHCRAWVRRKKTTFHDRFIIIDHRDVWMLGSSLNGLAKKHSTLVKLEYAEAVVSAFNGIWDSDDDARVWGTLIEVVDAS
jgi:hypothetical protein